MFSSETDGFFVVPLFTDACVIRSAYISLAFLCPNTGIAVPVSICGAGFGMAGNAFVCGVHSFYCPDKEILDTGRILDKEKMT